MSYNQLSGKLIWFGRRNTVIRFRFYFYISIFIELHIMWLELINLFGKLFSIWRGHKHFLLSKLLTHPVYLRYNTMWRRHALCNCLRQLGSTLTLKCAKYFRYGKVKCKNKCECISDPTSKVFRNMTHRMVYPVPIRIIGYSTTLHLSRCQCPSW